MKEITNKVMGNLQLNEDYELMSMLAKKQTQFFSVFSVKDLLKNYDFLSKGQYDPNWMDLSFYMGREKEVFEIYQKKLQRVDFLRELNKIMLTEEEREMLKKEYLTEFRVDAPEKVNVEIPKVICLGGVIMDKQYSTDHPTEIFNFKARDSTGEIEVIMSGADLVWEGRSADDHLTLIMEKDFHPNAIKSGNKYSLVVQALPEIFRDSRGVNKKDPKLRIYFFREEDERNKKKNKLSQLVGTF